MSGPMDGIRVVELSHEYGAWAGKLMADLGAEVIVVEPPGGAKQRAYGPFLDDEPGPERSLWWWHYNTSKHSVVVDLDDHGARERLVKLIDTADVLLECEPPGRLAQLQLDWDDLCARNSRLIHLSLTPFGRSTPDRDVPLTDLTLLAEGGPLWSCGYDDHSIPPIRGGGNQGYHTACHWAMIAVLTALIEREDSGLGQFIDTSMVAAANVTTEFSTYGYLTSGMVTQRQTGRHADAHRTMKTQVRCADGRYVNTGAAPRRPQEFAQLIEMIDEHGLRDRIPLIALLEMAANRESLSMGDISTDPMVAEMFTAARESRVLLAEMLPADVFFESSQRHGMAVGVLYAPEEVFEDPHFIDRGFPVAVEHPELGRSFTYPGAPYKFEKTPWNG